jgi:hypothetical protein
LADRFSPAATRPACTFLILVVDAVAVAMSVESTMDNNDVNPITYQGFAGHNVFDTSAR